MSGGEAARAENPQNLADREILSERLLDASRERLWEAFANPESLAQWWGPAGFTNLFEAFDFRPGGTWRLVMRAADGAEYAMQKVFVETTAPTRIVMDHLDPQHGHRLTMRFEDADGKTKVTWRMVFDSAKEAARVRPFILEANAQNFDRLADYLSKARA